MDVTWKHPFTCMVAGPTSCGKTSFVIEMVKQASRLIGPAPELIVWVHDDYQPALEVLKDKVTFWDSLDGVDDLPTDRPVLLIVDDQMAEAGEKMEKIFTKGSHHRNMSVVYIVQNLFDKGRHHRTISLNTHYLICFKNPRDATQIQTLAAQMFPGAARLVKQAFADATRKPWGYLMFDFRQDTPEDLRLRSGVLPNDVDKQVYVIEQSDQEASPEEATEVHY
jgi:hypothetical protein